MRESEITRRVRCSSQRVIAVLLSVTGLACTPIPWWVYVAETRVTAASGAGAFSEEEIERAQALTARVAESVGMETRILEPRDFDIGERRSANESPPRVFLSEYSGKLMVGRPLALIVEHSEDRRTLFFTFSDPNRGSPSPTFERIYKVLNENVAREFPTAVIVHDPRALGPSFLIPP